MTTATRYSRPPPAKVAAPHLARNLGNEFRFLYDCCAEAFRARKPDALARAKRLHDHYAMLVALPRPASRANERSIARAKMGVLRSLVREHADKWVPRPAAGPPPEHAVKVGPLSDPLAKLERQGLLTHAQLAAAREIERVYRAVCREVMTWGTTFWSAERDNMKVQSSGHSEMSDAMAWLHANRYKPWARRVVRELRFDLGGLLDVIVFGAPIPWRARSKAFAIRDALELYVEISTSGSRARKGKRRRRAAPTDAAARSPSTSEQEAALPRAVSHAPRLPTARS